MCRRNIARSFGSFATPIVATTRVYECLPTFSQLSCGKTYCQSEIGADAGMTGFSFVTPLGLASITTCVGWLLGVV